LLRRNEWSLATALSEGGYATGIFGKWHLGDNYPYRPQDRGFRKAVVHGGGGVSQTPDYWGNNYQDDVYSVDGEWAPFEGYCTDVWFDQGLRFIEQHRDEPFFCYISTNAPHSPYIVDERYSDPYVGQVEHQSRANFYGMIACIDENVSLLRKKLDEWGLAENTILIFMTDNGTSGGATLDEGQFVVRGYNAGMRGIKGSEYDGGHRVVFMMHWPGGGIDTGRDIPQLTANVDVMPTLLDLCGVDAGNHAFDGQSLVPLLAGGGAVWPERIMVTDSQRVAFPIKWRKSATMTQRWRLINGSELYDMESDPGQQYDVAAAHPEVVGWLREGYERWWEKVSEQFDSTIPIPIGTCAGGTVRLNSHDWRNDPVACAWNQAQIRAGLVCNGYWEIEVAAAGRYRFELRRWPKEEERAISAGIPGPIKRFTAEIKDGWGGGRALSLVRATLLVAGHEETQPIPAESQSVFFEVDLEAGETRVQTYLYDGDGQSIGAYYVYVTRLT
jgi:hypothetical protein